MGLFNKSRISFLNEKWEVKLENVKLKFIPRTHELIYLKSEGIYYRVVNVIHNVSDSIDIYIIIEEYTDDFALTNKVKK